MPSDSKDDELRDLVRPRVAEGGRFERVVTEMFDPGDEPKTWDRASIRLKTHPLHPRSAITHTDLLLPSGPDRLRLVGDSVAVGGALAVLAYFPLLLVGLAVEADIRVWIWSAVLSVGLAGSLYVFLRVWAAGPEDPRTL
jgi:hypothetical protein